jgi:hypothetical protein
VASLEERLRKVHAHVCASDGDIGDDDGEQLECGANERDAHEAGVCAAWDAIRDAATIGDSIGYARGRAEAFDELEQLCTVRIDAAAETLEGAAAVEWYAMLKAIRAAAARAATGEGKP